MALTAHEKRIVELVVKASGEADLKRISAELRATRVAAEQSQKSLLGMGGGFQQLTRLAGGFVGALGVQQVMAWGQAILDAADALDAAAEQAGIGVERYQTLKEAFRSLEVDGRKFEAGMERLSATMSDVLAGDSNTATKALDRLGISAKILSGEIQTTDELVDALASSQKALSGDVTFTADVVDLLGRKLGVDYANALRGGRLETAEMTAAMAEFGVVTEDELAKLADASEKVEQFKTRAGNAVLSWSATVITAFENAGSAFEGVSLRALAYSNMITAGTMATIEAIAALGEAERAASRGSLPGMMGSLLDAGNLVLGRVEGIRAAQAAPGNQPGASRPSRSRGGGGGGRTGPTEADRAAAAELERRNKLLERQAQLQHDAAEAWKREQDALADLAAGYNEAADPLLRYTRQLEELNRVQATGILTDAGRRAELERIANEYLEGVDAIERATPAIETNTGAIDEQKKSAEELREQWEFIGYAVGQATYDIIAGTEKVGVAVKKMVAAILAEAARLAAVKIAAKVVDALFPTPAAKGAVFAGPVAEFAKGGILTGPQVFGMAGGGIGVAGEAGPEMVAPLRRDAAGNLGVGAVPPRVVVNNYAGADVAVSPTPEGMQIDIMRRVLADDIRRGGNVVSGALEGAYRLGRHAGAFG